MTPTLLCWGLLATSSCPETGRALSPRLLGDLKQERVRRLQVHRRPADACGDGSGTANLAGQKLKGKSLLRRRRSRAGGSRGAGGRGRIPTQPYGWPRKVPKDGDRNHLTSQGLPSADSSANYTAEGLTPRWGPQPAPHGSVKVLQRRAPPPRGHTPNTAHLPHAPALEVGGPVHDCASPGCPQPQR